MRTRRTSTSRRSPPSSCRARSQDVDLAVINGNYALQADLNATRTRLITENPEYAQVYVKRCACRSGDENSEKIQALAEALQSDTVKQFIDETIRARLCRTF